MSIGYNVERGHIRDCKVVISFSFLLFMLFYDSRSYATNEMRFIYTNSFSSVVPVWNAWAMAQLYLVRGRLNRLDGSPRSIPREHRCPSFDVFSRIFCWSWASLDRFADLDFPLVGLFVFEHWSSDCFVFLSECSQFFTWSVARRADYAEGSMYCTNSLGAFYDTVWFCGCALVFLTGLK